MSNDYDSQQGLHKDDELYGDNSSEGVNPQNIQDDSDLTEEDFEFENDVNSNLSDVWDTDSDLLDDDESAVQKFRKLQRKDTNFIFLFGKPASGKSYITASLIYAMQTSEYGSLRICESNSRDSEVLMENMYNHFHNGRIIDRTTVTAPPYEIDLVFEPNDASLPEMRITFLEMSGENLQKVSIRKGDENSGKFPEDIDTFLDCPDLDLIFFLVTDPKNVSKDSIMFHKFLSYSYNKDKRFGNANHLLTISKWDTYEGKYKNSVEKFTKNEMPQVHNHLRKTNITNAITHYSIGKVHSKTVNGVRTDEIVKVDKSRADEVTKWLYKTITNRSLIPEPSGWVKFLQFLGIN